MFFAKNTRSLLPFDKLRVNSGMTSDWKDKKEIQDFSLRSKYQ